jgi:hypothetical protein
LLETRGKKTKTKKRRKRWEEISLKTEQGKQNAFPKRTPRGWPSG